MSDAIILVISAVVSMILFSFLFYKLNCKFGLFEPIRRKIDALNENNKKKLVLVFYAIVLITVFGPMDGMNNIAQGVVFGIVFSFKDVCFKTNFMETSPRKS